MYPRLPDKATRPCDKQCFANNACAILALRTAQRKQCLVDPAAYAAGMTKPITKKPQKVNVKGVLIGVGLFAGALVLAGLVVAGDSKGQRTSPSGLEGQLLPVVRE